MIKRTARFHKQSDSPFFWGCSRYPNCKTTRIYSPEDEEPITLTKVPAEQQLPQQGAVKETKPEAIWNFVPGKKLPDPDVPGLIKGSPEQEAVWYFMRAGTQHGVIDAVAGSGKSFTIVQGGLRMKGMNVHILVCAFNKHIAVEMNDKLKKAGITWMVGSTTHSVGNMAVKTAFPHAKLDKYKLSKIVKEYVQTNEPKAVTTGTMKLVQLCKNYVFDGRDRERLLDLMAHHAIDIDHDSLERVLDLVPIVLVECLRREATYDYDDMIHWVVVKKLPVTTYNMVLVDEAQDTNKLTQELLFMCCPSGRILVVGDTHQAIYGFRGADTSAMRNLFSRLDSTEKHCRMFPLTVTRRCPKSHVRLAQAIVPHIKALDDAPEGIIESLEPDKAILTMKPGDLVICRTNAPLVPVCYSLLKRGVKAQIKGRDIGEGLITLIKNLKSSGEIPDLLEKLTHWADREIEKLSKLGEKAEAQIEAIQDKADVIAALCEGLSNVDSLLVKIDEIFSDFTTEGERKEAVVLGTAHRTKGLEAFDVFILEPKLIPHPAAKLDWQIEQERNLAYVAVTRAKFDKEHEGRLVFMGTIPGIYNAALPPVVGA